MNDLNESRERRRAAKQRLAALRAELREARVRQRSALLDAKERCRAERLATRERHRALRIRAAQELRDERADVRAACVERRANARRIGDDVGRARAQVIAERANQAEMRRLAKAERVRHGGKGARGGVAQTDDEIAGSLPSDLAPLFERVKGSLKRTHGGEERRSAFLAYAESHPDEVLAANENAASARVQNLEAEIARTKVEARAPNAYEARKAARVERMRARAERLGQAATGARAAADAIAGHIPMGQPILVGHHSEKRHRRDLGRIRKNFTKSVDLAQEAKDLERRADYAESNRAISSDDPDALEKLRMKIEQLDVDRTRMVLANKAMRSKTPREILAKLGYSPARTEELLKPDELGRQGFPDYRLQNAASESRRLKKRLFDLEDRTAKLPPAVVVFPGGCIEEADNRVRVVFDAKPAEDVRTALKKAGFRWSPTSGAWQRHASNGAWYEAKRILGVGSAAGFGSLPSKDVKVAPAPPAARAETSAHRERGGESPEVARRGMTRSVLAIVRNAAPDEAHIAWEKEKAAAVRLEKAGLVTIRRTSDRTGGLLDWWVRLTPKGARGPGALLADPVHVPVANVSAPAPPPATPSARPVVQGEGLDTAAIAKRIREDVKAAMHAGKLPLATYSVRTSKYSMGSTITVVASMLPFPVLNPDVFVVEPGASWMTFDRTNNRSRFTLEAQEVERTLNAIVDAYHWDRSDPMTDYYNERFHRDVRIEEEKGEWQRLGTAKVAAARPEDGRG